MVFPRALALLAVATLLCSSAAVDAKKDAKKGLKYSRPDFLPLLSLARLPNDCGSVYQVLPGDTCESIA